MSDIDRVHQIPPAAPIAAAPERVGDQRRQKKQSEADLIELHLTDETPLPEAEEPEDLVEAPNHIDFRA